MIWIIIASDTVAVAMLPLAILVLVQFPRSLSGLMVPTVIMVAKLTRHLIHFAAALAIRTSPGPLEQVCRVPGSASQFLLALVQG